VIPAAFSLVYGAILVLYPINEAMLQRIEAELGSAGAGRARHCSEVGGAFLGNRGQSYFYNGTGSAPGADADLRVTGRRAPPARHTPSPTAPPPSVRDRG